MRILILTPVYPPRVGGMEAFLADELVPEFRRRGHDVAVVAGIDEPHTAPTCDEVDGVSVLRTPTRPASASPAWLLNTRRDVSAFIRAFDADVVHSHDVGLLAWLYQRIEGTAARPVVTTVHYIMTVHLPESLEVVASRLVAADWVTGVSQAVVDDMLTYAPSVAAKCSVVPNAVHVPAPTVVGRAPADPPTVLCVGRLVEQKGFDLAIAAFGAIASRHPTARLVVVGDGPLARDLAAQAAAVPGADRIEFLGEVDRLHVADLMGESVAVLMPSRWEGHPLVALEAARAGRPVIASRCPGGLVDVVVDGGTGIVVDADDVPGLAAALHELLANRPLARALGDEARRRAERGPSVSDCAARYEDIFGSLGATRDRW